MNDTIIALDSILHLLLPISGKTVSSNPIIASTKALTKIRIRNYWISTGK